jgi:hypothetical protein
MTDQITPDEVVSIAQPQTSQGQPLTHEQLVEVWKKDKYWGASGDYTCNPLTGERTPITGV